MVAGLVLGQKDDLVAVVFSGAVLVVFAHKELATHNRSYFGLGHEVALLIFFEGLGIGCLDGFVFLLDGRYKMKGPHHIGVVCQGHRRHLIC